MSNPCILMLGPSIAVDEELISKLQKIAIVLRSLQNSKIELILKAKKVDLILIEILKETGFELKIIKNVKDEFPNIAIILIDGDSELIAEAFSYGVKDAFRKPYKSSLVVERVRAILGIAPKQPTEIKQS